MMHNAAQRPKLMQNPLVDQKNKPYVQPYNVILYQAILLVN